MTSTKSFRPALTLMEVLVSLAIFLISLVALTHLVNIGTQAGVDARLTKEATFLCQSKLAEFKAGIEPLESKKDVAFVEEESSWLWSALCEPVEEIPDLWRVEVTVHREREGRSPLEVTITQLILAPGIRGSSLDPPPLDLTGKTTQESEEE